MTEKSGKRTFSGTFPKAESEVDGSSASSYCFLVIITLLLAAAAPFDPWMSFERSPAFEASVSVEVGTLHNDDDEVIYEFRRTIQDKSGAQTSWADTQRCPQARDVLVNATRLERPAVSIPFLVNREILVTADGIGYHLTAGAQYEGSGFGDIEFSSNVDTPLARWVDDSLALLNPCWTTDRVVK